MEVVVVRTIFNLGGIMKFAVVLRYIAREDSLTYVCICM